MSKRNIAMEILSGIREIKKHQAGLVQLRTPELIHSFEPGKTYYVETPDTMIGTGKALMDEMKKADDWH